MKPRKNPRGPQLAKIHVAIAQLGLDEATYRALYERVTGKNSAARMSVAERDAVIAELARLGFQDTRKANGKAAFPGRPANTDQVPMLGKIEALLADSGRQWEYARATAKRMFNVERLEWLTDVQLHKLVSALQIDANRRSRSDQGLR